MEQPENKDYITNEELHDRIVDLNLKLNFLLMNYIVSEEGIFCFPDGEMWKCREKKNLIEPKY